MADKDAATKLQALRHIYLIYKSVQLEEYSQDIDTESQREPIRRGLLSYLRGYLSEYANLVTVRRLRNALVNSSTVNLAQQLCGSSQCAGILLCHVSNPGDTPAIREAMFYSLGYAMLGAALSAALIKTRDVRVGIMTFFLYLFSAAYSPGLVADMSRSNPVHPGLRKPPSFASRSVESLIHVPNITTLFVTEKQQGCASAIAVNLLFAGFLTLFFPSIVYSLQDGGALGLFSGLNLLAFVLIFLLVEETKRRRSGEDLDLVFAVCKSKFISHQLTQYLPWLFRYYIRRDKTAEQPSLYLDLIWGPKVGQSPKLSRTSIPPLPHNGAGEQEQSIEPEGVRNSADTDHN
ncbi:sugar transporter [Apiospora phragmitis]|uniref:Sugar transporter n=1 Tax=Apiospora phragmitis TaxID=2905665 RepID=A0ABR1SU88_9PEZI